MALPISLFFFFFLTFLNSQGRILGWCLRFITAVYWASCHCYPGKLQTVHKTLHFLDTVNSHLGLRPFFLLWVQSCLNHCHRDLRCMFCDTVLRVGVHHVTVSDPGFGTNSVKIMLKLRYFCTMAHNVSQRWWGVSSEWLLHEYTFIFSVLICNFHLKCLSFSPRSWCGTTLPRSAFSSVVLWTPRHQRKVHLAHSKSSLAKPRLQHSFPDTRIRIYTWVVAVSQLNRVS